jgi:hypothetical protein
MRVAVYCLDDGDRHRKNRAMKRAVVSGSGGGSGGGIAG